jgi:hypothetical protein
MKRTISIGLAGLIGFAVVVLVRDQQTVNSIANEPGREQSSLPSDEQYLESYFKTGSVEAAKAVISRGEKMIPVLMRLRGDESAILPGGLGNPDSSQSVKLTGKPRPNAKSVYESDADVFTKEVVALYFICAIYHRDLMFAQNPLLTDLSLPSDKRRARNTKELVDRAWAAVEVWERVLGKEGLSSLQSKGYDPLKGSQVAFW